MRRKDWVQGVINTLLDASRALQDGRKEDLETFPVRFKALEDEWLDREWDELEARREDKDGCHRTELFFLSLWHWMMALDREIKNRILGFPVRNAETRSFLDDARKFARMADAPALERLSVEEGVPDARDNNKYVDTGCADSCEAGLVGTPVPVSDRCYRT